LGGLIAGLVIAGAVWPAARPTLTIAGTVLILLLLAGVLWHNANQRADGDEWWQDDDPSGWR
jgi:hypothetical protein